MVCGSQTVLYRVFELSKYLHKQLYITCSSILETQGSTDIGLKLLSSILSPALNTGTTFAIFKSLRNILYSKDKINRYY